MSEPQSVSVEPGVAVFEGTWDELLPHAREFADKKLRLTILANDDPFAGSRVSRVAAIDAVFGKYAHLGVSVNDLHQERQTDKLRENRKATGPES